MNSTLLGDHWPKKGTPKEVPEDERAHADCFSDGVVMATSRDCDGDGGYRCRECVRCTGKDTR